MVPTKLSEALERGEEAFNKHDYEDAIREFKSALNIVDRQPQSFSREKNRAEILMRIVDSLERNGKWLDALMYVETIANIARIKRDVRLEIDAGLKGGSILVKRGSWREALARFKQLQGSVESHGNPRQKGECLYGLATGEWRLGNNNEAKVIAQRAVDILKESGDKEHEARAIILLASIFHARGIFDQSISLFKEAIEILHKMDDGIDIARAHNNLGEVYKAMGDYASATEQYTYCVDLARKTNNKRSEIYGLTNATECLARMGDIEEAERRLSVLEGLLETYDDEYVLANIDFVKGLVAAKRENAEEMKRRFSCAMERMEKLETPYDLGIFAFEYALSLRSMGQQSDAINMFTKAKEAFQKANASSYLAKVEKEENSLI